GTAEGPVPLGETRFLALGNRRFRRLPQSLWPDARTVWREQGPLTICPAGSGLRVGAGRTWRSPGGPTAGGAAAGQDTLAIGPPCLVTPRSGACLLSGRPSRPSHPMPERSREDLPAMGPPGIELARAQHGSSTARPWRGVAAVVRQSQGGDRGSGHK